MEDEIFKPCEVSKFMKVSRSWPYVMAKRGLLPYYKMNKIIRFKRSDIEEFFERSKVK